MPIRPDLRTLYFPAVTEREARDLVASGYGWETREEAERHLREIEAEADPYYGNQYRVYAVEVDADPR